MIITALGYTESNASNGWSIERCEFRQYVNLIVGASAAGKTKLLNAIFDMATMVVRDAPLRSCSGFVEFSIDEVSYRWKISTSQRKPNEAASIDFESLEYIGGNKIIERDANSTTFNGEKLFKLPRNTSALRILREEDVISAVHDGFSKIRRRQFQGSELENARAVQTIAPHFIEACKSRKKISEIHDFQLTLSAVAELLRDYFPREFRLTIEHFRRVFPSVEDVRVMGTQQLNIAAIGNPSILLIKERGSQDAVPITEWSSGMVKVFLLITDVLTQPRPSIYMIDEYENSLGVNAIDFFPAFARELGEQIQFFLTSHHPMLINAMPISDWIVLGRRGNRVSALYGDKLKERYGISHHEQYVNLLNDPFYQGQKN